MSIDRFFTEYGLYQRPLSMKVLFWLLDNPEESLSWASFQTTRQKLRTATRYLLKKGLITTKCRESDAKVTHYSPVTERLQPILLTTKQPQANHELTTSRPHVYKTGTQAGSYAHYLDSKQKNKTTKKEKNPSQPISALKRQYENEFDNDFWPLCQRKIGKAHCRRAYVSLRTHNRTDLTATELVELYNRHLMQAREVQFSKHPSTWLNAECWEDQEAQVKTEDSYEKVTTPLLNPEYDSTEDKLARIWPDWKVDFARWVPSVFPEMADPKLWEDYAYTMYWEARNKNGGVKLV